MDTLIISTKAKIRLYNNQNGRKTPFVNGYRPLFTFVDDLKTSGQIILLDREKFYPGEEGIVKIKFICSRLLGDNFGAGKKFIFGEGRSPLGEGEIIELLYA